MPTLPWTLKTSQEPRQEYTSDAIVRAKAEFNALPAHLVAASAFLLGAVTTIGVTMVYTRFGRRLRNSEYITPDVLVKKRWVKGVVTSVGDGDNFRLFHTPALGGWHWPLRFRRVPRLSRDLKDQTLHIRIAGVDAPEGAHFGRPAQPFAEESLAWLRKQILGRIVYCQLLRRDQYSRVVAYVVLSPRVLPGAFVSGKSLAMEMLKAGWVTTYEQAGAEYGKWGKEEFLRVEAEAKVARRGMWKYGSSGESPSAYKRRYAQMADKTDVNATASVEPKSASRTTGLWKRIFG